MSALRMIAMATPYPYDETGADGVLPREAVARLQEQVVTADWTGVGSLYGPAEVVRGARRTIRRILRMSGVRVTFASTPTVVRARRVLRMVSPRERSRLPASLQKRIEITTGLLMRTQAHLRLLEGRPSEAALRLAYWRSGVSPPASDLDPARDGCGVLWYSPLVPMTARAVSEYVTMVRQICPRFGIEPIVTLTSLSERCFDSTVPILFAQADEAEAERAAEVLRVPLRARPEERPGALSLCRRFDATGHRSRGPVLADRRPPQGGARPGRPDRTRSLLTHARQPGGSLVAGHTDGSRAVRQSTPMN